MTFGKYGHFERNEVGEMDERWFENVRPSPLFFAAKITSAIVEKEVTEMKRALVIALAVITLLSSGCGIKKRTVVNETYDTIETVYVIGK